MRDEPAVLDPADADPRVQSSLRAWVAFQRAWALQPRRGARLLREWGGPARALSAVAGAHAHAATAERDLARLRAQRVLAVPCTSSAFPPQLRHLDDAPLLLLVRGDPGAWCAPCIAVVGSRAPTRYGRSVAERFAAAFARAGACVVSGLANGIDAVAHRAALDAGGSTLAVQACGPDLVYPARHRELAARIAAGGAVVSELAPGTPPRRAQFPFRNRLISALSRAVLVVEARERSGSLVTARHAADQCVEVHAVPGPIDAPTSAGTNRLLQDGAHVALEPEDLLRPLGLTPVPPRTHAGAVPAPQLAPSCRELLAALVDAPATLDELASRLGRPPEQLAPDLLELELGGRIATDRDGRLRALSTGGRGL